MQGRVCILIPVLNEARNIEALWSRISTVLAVRPFTICFVDDGSNDGTVDFIQRLIVLDPERVALIRRRKMMRGSQRGSALQAALQWAVGRRDLEYVVEMDGDLSHRPEEMLEGLAILESGRADVAIASKYLPGSDVVNRATGRRAVSRICNFAVRLLLDSRISDYSNGYRFYTRRAALAIAGSQIRYGSPIYLSEVMAIWLHDGFRVAEFESVYVGRNEGLSKLRPLDLVKASVGICEIAWRYHPGRFGVLTVHEDAASTPAHPIVHV
jgi:dolichol-phosphate mannosyltransferase